MALHWEGFCYENLSVRQSAVYVCFGRGRDLDGEFVGEKEARSGLDAGIG